MNRFMQFDEWTESIQRLDEQIESDFKSGEAQAAELFAQLSFWKKSMEQIRFVRWEAMLYTCMGIIHYKNDPYGQAAGSWLRQAIQLEPEQPKAWLYLDRAILHELSSLFEDITMEPIRQVDPTEHKKKKILEIQHTVQRMITDTLERGKERLEEGKDAQQYTERPSDLWGEADRLLEMLPPLLRELEDACILFTRSVSGLYVSEELVGAVNGGITEVEAVLNQWDECFSGFRQLKTETPSALTRLDSLIGMSDIKKRIRDLYHFLLYLSTRQEKGLHMRDSVSLHAVITGNPGTGKTTVARLLAEIYHELNILEHAKIVEVDRSHLVGSYIGHTEQKVMEAVERAVGGVLFIDEAYSLKRGGSAENDFGQVAIDTLVAAMTGSEYAGKFAVVLAGYPEEMRLFLQANPGLRSRFPENGHFHLPDFTTEELIAIGRQVARNNDFILTESAIRSMEHRIEWERVDRTFGNARTVKNIVLEAVIAKGRKLSEGASLAPDEFSILYKEDFHQEQPAVKPAVERLEALVGLQDIKEEIRMLFAFLTIQQERKALGLPVVPLQLHAVFSGNPGTGKTTVAEIYASIAKEAGMLKRGHLVTASRSDLVGQYVGQTAIKTRRKIAEALGGVLFIDEAHSLLAASPGDYGAEAIDTLVEEMTRHNENLAVIFAGYPDLIERLLDSNPGLRSRFKKFFHFPDYSAGQLTEVAEHYARELGYILSPGAIRQLQMKFAEQQDNDGNARLARSVIENAIQFQAKRLLDTGQKTFTAEQLTQIEAEDILSGSSFSCYNITE